jgi:hypothetical protein
MGMSAGGRAHGAGWAAHWYWTVAVAKPVCTHSLSMGEYSRTVLRVLRVPKVGTMGTPRAEIAVIRPIEHSRSRPAGPVPCLHASRASAVPPGQPGQCHTSRPAGPVPCLQASRASAVPPARGESRRRRRRTAAGASRSWRPQQAARPRRPRPCRRRRLRHTALMSNPRRITRELRAEHACSTRELRAEHACTTRELRAEHACSRRRCSTQAAADERCVSRAVPRART